LSAKTIHDVPLARSLPAPPPCSAKLRGLDQVPRPFVIEPPEANGGRPYQPGERFDFRLVLVGRAIDYLPYFLFTFSELGRVGLGLSRGRFQVAEVHSEGLHDARQVYSAAEGVLHDGDGRITAEALAQASARVADRSGEASRVRLAVHFLTPTRIRNDGAIRAEVSFQDLVRALLRRLSSLCYFHCGGELQADFRCLIDQASAVRTVASQLRWQRQERFSARQGQRIEMGGVVGTVTFEADGAEVLGPYRPLLAAGFNSGWRSGVM
jgi:hypothetical protein